VEAEGSNLRYFVDGVIKGKVSFAAQFYDNPHNLHYIGAELNTSITGTQYFASYFRGYIYSIAVEGIYTEKISRHIDFSGACGDGYCTSCPDGPVCLLNCGVMEYLDAHGECRHCAQDCLDGCLDASYCG
jgi:hypothetical protein